MENLPRIYVDWNECWGPNLMPLDLPATMQCFKDQGVPIEAGIKIRLFGDELEADAVIVWYERGPDEIGGPGFWVAKFEEPEDFPFEKESN
jgi:hypothetical protein